MAQKLLLSWIANELFDENEQALPPQLFLSSFPEGRADRNPTGVGMSGTSLPGGIVENDRAKLTDQ